MLGTHAGQDIFVCGTGTSLAGFDWTRLHDCVTIALNDAINARGFRPTYHLWRDVNLYERYIKRCPGTTAVVPSDGAHLVEGEYAEVVTYNYVSEDDLHIVAENDSRWPPPYGQFRFASRAVAIDNDDISSGHTIATGGIQFAAKLGARRIFLVGCDAYSLTNADYFDARMNRIPCEHHKPVDLGGGRWRTSKHFYWDIEMWKLREWFEELRLYAGPWPQGGVYNCSELSTLTAWQKVPLDLAIEAQGGLSWRPSQPQAVMQPAMP
jgi:hypothetical protein